MWMESMSLKDEKNYMSELTALKRNRSKVADISQMEDKIANLRAGKEKNMA